MKIRHLKLGLVCGFSFLVSGIATAESETVMRAKTRQTMGDIFGVFQEVLPLSMNHSEFANPKNRTKILNHLQSLAKKGTELSEHQMGHDATFAFYRGNFQTDLNEGLQKFKEGDHRAAQYIMRNLTDNCISCHTRLPSTHDAPRALSFFKKVEKKGLSDLEQVELYTAMRQFNKAVETYETIFLNPTRLQKIAPALIGSHVIDYLVLSLRVLGEPSRPQKVLQYLSKQQHLPFYLKKNTKTWQKFLNNLAKKPVDSFSLQGIEALVNHGQSLNQYPLDDSGAIVFIYASSTLHQMLYKSEKQLSAQERSRAYYLLAITELAIDRPHIIQPAPFYFEKSIRADPTSATAESAYKALESYIYFQNSGSAGVFVSEQDLKRLASLKSILGKKVKTN